MPTGFYIEGGELRRRPDTRGRSSASEYERHAIAPIYSEIELKAAQRVRPALDLTRTTKTALDKFGDETSPYRKHLNDIFAEYKIPIGLSKKLLALKEFTLCFLIDDSGSMVFKKSDVKTNQAHRTMDILPGTWMSRLQEVEHRLHIVIDILACLPGITIQVQFMNLTKHSFTLSNDDRGIDSFKSRGHLSISETFKEISPLIEASRFATPTVPAFKRVLTLAKKWGNTAIYFATDGEPNDLNNRNTVSEQKREFQRLLEVRPSPASTPISLWSCSNNDAETGWLKALEERAPLCSELDDYRDERDEITKDQGKGFPFTYGMWVISLLVAANDPNVLDAIDENMPFTRYTMTQLLGRHLTQEDYHRYFNQHPLRHKFNYPIFLHTPAHARQLLPELTEEALLKKRERGEITEPTGISRGPLTKYQLQQLSGEPCSLQTYIDCFATHPNANLYLLPLYATIECHTGLIPKDKLDEEKKHPPTKWEIEKRLNCKIGDTLYKKLYDAHPKSGKYASIYDIFLNSAVTAEDLLSNPHLALFNKYPLSLISYNALLPNPIDKIKYLEIVSSHPCKDVVTIECLAKISGTAEKISTAIANSTNYPYTKSELEARLSSTISKDLYKKIFFSHPKGLYYKSLYCIFEKSHGKAKELMATPHMAAYDKHPLSKHSYDVLLPESMSEKDYEKTVTQHHTSSYSTLLFLSKIKHTANVLLKLDVVKRSTEQPLTRHDLNKNLGLELTEDEYKDYFYRQKNHQAIAHLYRVYLKTDKTTKALKEEPAYSDHVRAPLTKHDLYKLAGPTITQDDFDTLFKEHPKNKDYLPVQFLFDGAPTTTRSLLSQSCIKYYKTIIPTKSELEALLGHPIDMHGYLMRFEKHPLYESMQHLKLVYQYTDKTGSELSHEHFLDNEAICPMTKASFISLIGKPELYDTYFAKHPKASEFSTLKNLFIKSSKSSAVLIAKDGDIDAIRHAGAIAGARCEMPIPRHQRTVTIKKCIFCSTTSVEPQDKYHRYFSAHPTVAMKHLLEQEEREFYQALSEVGGIEKWSASPKEICDRLMKKIRNKEAHRAMEEEIRKRTPATIPVAPAYPESIDAHNGLGGGGGALPPYPQVEPDSIHPSSVQVGFGGVAV